MVRSNPTLTGVTIGGGSVVSQANGNYVTLVSGLTNDGIIAPGTSAGLLTIAGDVTNHNTAKLAIELGGINAGQFDQLRVNGSFAAGGDLNVSFLGGFYPGVTDSFTILSATTLSGFFNNATPSSGLTAFDVCTGDARFDVTYNFSQDTITLTNVQWVPEPASMFLLAAGGAGWLRRKMTR